MDVFPVPTEDKQRSQEYLLYSDVFHAHLQYHYTDSLLLAATFLEYSVQSSCRITWNTSDEYPEFKVFPRTVNDSHYQGIVLSIRFPCDELRVHTIGLANHPFIMGSKQDKSFVGTSEKLHFFANQHKIPLGTTFSIESAQNPPLISIEKRLLAEDLQAMLLIAPLTETDGEAADDVLISPYGGNEELSFSIRSKSHTRLTLIFQWNFMAPLFTQKSPDLFSQVPAQNYTNPHVVTKYLYADGIFHAGSPYRTHTEYKDLVVFTLLNASILSKKVLLSSIDMLLHSASEHGILPLQFFNRNEAATWRIIRGGTREQKSENLTEAMYYFGDDIQIFLFPLMLLHLLADNPALQSYASFKKMPLSPESHTILRIYNAAAQTILASATFPFPEALLEHKQYDPTAIKDARYSGLLNVHIIPSLLQHLDRWYVSIAEQLTHNELAHFCVSHHLEGITELIAARGTRASIDSWTNNTQHFEVEVANDKIEESVHRFFNHSKLDFEEKNFLYTQTVHNANFSHIVAEWIHSKKPLRFFVKSLDIQAKPIPVMTANFCFNMYFLKAEAFYLAGYCDLLELPYPLGLRTPIGIVSENVCYVTDESIIEQETASQGGARILYVWQQCMLLHGLYRLSKYTDLYSRELLIRMDHIYTWLYKTVTDLPITCDAYTFSCKNQSMSALPMPQAHSDSVSLLYGCLAGLQALPERLL